MNKFFFSVSDEYREKLSYGFAGVGCYYEQEHVKRPGAVRIRNGYIRSISGFSAARVPESFGLTEKSTLLVWDKGCFYSRTNLTNIWR